MVDDFIGSVFGSNGQLIVLCRGDGKIGHGRLYKVHCTECAKDPELFGDGFFYSTKGNLQRGQLSCGCAMHIRWTKDQYIVRLERECKKLGGLEFIGFSGEFKGVDTKIVLQCSKHETIYTYKTNRINDLLSGHSGCHLCKTKNTKLRHSKPDKEIIDSFFASGAFKEVTKFYRSERKNSDGSLRYWNYTCPVCSNDEYTKEGLCSGVFESYSGDLQRGKLACRCALTYRWSMEQREYQINKRIKEENLTYTFIGWVGSYKNSKSKFSYLCEQHGEQKISIDHFLYANVGCPKCGGMNQRECYINGVYDKETLVALKFGIANNSNRRVKEQNNKCVFEVRQLKVFTFSSVGACKAAETTCKQELTCGILSKQEMPDGFSETTSPLNMDKVIDIYKRFGGVENKSK